MTTKLQSLPGFLQLLVGLLISIICTLIGLLLFLVYVYTFAPDGIGALILLWVIMLLSNTFGFFLVLRYLSKSLIRQSNLIAEHEKELAEAETEHMRANLLRAVSHDIRTPLTGIIGNSSAYLESKDFLTTDEKDDIVRNIYEDSTWLIHMVENLLSITRINDNSLPINTSEEPVEEVVGEALSKIEKRYPTCSIRAAIPDDFILLPMDAMLIEQVIINLCENALLHSGSIEPMDFIVQNQADYVSFTVKDYGRGIPENKLDHLFEGQAYQAGTSDVQKGMGIGLVICKTIITAHHGTLVGYNHEHGAIFTFTLPKTNGKKE